MSDILTGISNIGLTLSVPTLTIRVIQVSHENVIVLYAVKWKKTDIDSDVSFTLK